MRTSAPFSKVTNETYPSDEQNTKLLPLADQAMSLIEAKWNPPSFAIGWTCCVSYTSTDETVATANIIRYLPGNSWSLLVLLSHAVGR